MKKTPKKIKVDRFEDWPKLAVKDGETVMFSAEINGCEPGTKATVMHSVHDGAIILVRVETGRKAGAEFRVRAVDLM